MILYHGSTAAVAKPQILAPSRLLDFGEGFYATSNFEQALRWSNKVAERKEVSCATINTYEVC